jgi:hypothetical protein
MSRSTTSTSVPSGNIGMQPVAISSLDVTVPSNLRVAYVPGVGDNVAPSLRQLGIPVTIVQPADIPSAGPVSVLDCRGRSLVLIRRAES